MDFKEFLDFRLDFNLDRDIRILQLTDMQPVDPSQQRYDGRLDYYPFNAKFTDEIKYKNEFYYLDKAIKDNNPDLIIITGDIVYGEFDDNGSNLIEFCNFMDSYKIPWAPIFGNHDNESKLGVTWQVNQFLNAKYSLFKRNNITGNGNYNIGIFNKGELIRVIYMMDSNGIWNGKTYSYLKDYPPYNQDERVERNSGLYPDQREYLYSTAREIDRINKKQVKKTFCSHIPPDFVNKYAFMKGYQSTSEGFNKDYFDLGGTSLIDNKDFGEKCEDLGGFNSLDLYDRLKELSFDTIFVGHFHINTLSIDCDGIRLSYGIKSSTYDYHKKIGSLLFSSLFTRFSKFFATIGLSWIMFFASTK